MVSRNVFCGASRPLITGILVRVEGALRARRPAAVDSDSDPKPGKNLERRLVLLGFSLVAASRRCRVTWCLRGVRSKAEAQRER
ncbi:hypothetical protein SKAU_G00243520 [Synaphobranchus kaupii]|uniref:Uncharacterized protein n=1 Tax=Synaphobranchus kaupii TaxID=118154 RepID=A0A9Q1F7Y2_SYNKA|nr:hypothetical protein SKAU_G00243520 [Synaphobranchus kaupii]